MIVFYKSENIVFACDFKSTPSQKDLKKLVGLFSNAEISDQNTIKGTFIGPRKEMISPWSTNAVEIAQNMGIEGISRIEQFIETTKGSEFDPMLQMKYNALNQDIFSIDKKPDPIIFIDDITAYNQQEGLALSKQEIEYLELVTKKIGRKLTDSEVFGFSQVNSEHCRHKIFNGTFIIDDKQMPDSLFGMIRKTSKVNPNYLVSAYRDNVAFIQGPNVEQFAPATQDKPDYFVVTDIDTVISLKAETHNFPTTVEPFNGAATGSGGEIRDRMAGGKGSIPIAGTAVYMTSYPRTTQGRNWENATNSRPWLYQTPEQILIKASNGASDFGNKFGQPLICGSVLTFEHFTRQRKLGYDKVIMLAGGVGIAKKQDSLKDTPEKGDKVIVMGGDNYRIGMGGGAVSSVDTGKYTSDIELNAVQRSNPEMQKRVYNALRALAELPENPIVSVHDHGAGGHLNSLSELVEETGGTIDMDKLPIGDPTLSAKEIIGNESQERMGLILKKKHINLLKQIAERERAPFYLVGSVTGDHNFCFQQADGQKPIDLQLSYLFGEPPQTIMKDITYQLKYQPLEYNSDNFQTYLENVLQVESVACKDWLTNKVDRSVTGKIAKQQCAGSLQLPLNNAGVVAIDYRGRKGMATAIGHAPVAALINPAAGSQLSIAESLTNLVWSPLSKGMKGISLSANWMWPCRNKGEDARLYKAVQAASNFAIDLGINIPTGKDSLSMTQKYKDETVISPGTVIISAVAEVEDIRKVVEPVIQPIENSQLIFIDFSASKPSLGGSAFAQIINRVGVECPEVADANYFKTAFETLQELIKENKILAGHDIAAGGMIVSLLEMTFAERNTGMDIDISDLPGKNIIENLFAENPGVIIQVNDKEVVDYLKQQKLNFYELGEINKKRSFTLKFKDFTTNLPIDKLRDLWFKTSFLLDRKQSGDRLAGERYENFKNHVLTYDFPAHFMGKKCQCGINPDRREPAEVKAAIIREKGVNGDREMAYSMYLAGIDVKDVHMTDLISGREDLKDVNFIVFVGGFSNSDVLGSAKGWAGAFLHNPKAKKALDGFYARQNTLSLGICNGCQLMIELDLICPDHTTKPKMMHNDSHKFESNFINVDIQQNHSVMLSSLAGSRMGVWIAHAEGKFQLPFEEARYNIPAKYSYSTYPANPNGSDFNAACIVSDNGRHLAMMPHIERSIFPWQWGHYPETLTSHEVSPWIEAFTNARDWIKRNRKR